MAQRLTIEDIKKGFKDKGWTLLTTEYINNQQKLDAICGNGHNTTITWCNFKNGQGCRFCGTFKRYTYEEVKSKFEEHGCKLLSEKYIHNNDPLDYICSCGKVSKIAFSHLLNGGKCRECGNKKTASKLRKSNDEIELFCQKHQCILIELIHETNNHTKIKYICKCGRESEAFLNNFKRFPNCWECGKEKKSGDKCYLWNPNREQIKKNKRFQKRCDTLLRRTLRETDQEKLNNTHSTLGYTPKELQDHILNNDYFKDNEQDDWHIDHYFPIKAFIDHNINDLKVINNLNNLRPLSGKENLSKGGKYDKEEFIQWLKDINAEQVIPDISDIESDLNIFLKTINTDKMHVKLINPFNYLNRQSLKSELLKINGKNPVFLLPYEWMNRQSQCKNRLLAISGTFSRRIYARKCKIENISIKTHAQFCRNYHIQGNNKLTITAWGLFYNNELLGSISLGRHHRNYNDILLLDRLCFAPDIQVVGGANRLFNQCKEWAEERGVKQIVSFSDNRWSLGNVYENLEFKLDKELAPDYYYVKDGQPFTLLSKQSQKKSNTNCPTDITELEWAIQHGLVRSYDCGKKRWVYELT